MDSPRWKQPTIRDTTTGFPAKGCLRNERKNSIFMTCHYPDLSVSDWLKQISHAVRPIRSVDKGSDTSSVWNFCARSFALKPVLASQNVGCFQVKWILLLICRIHILFLWYFLEDTGTVYLRRPGWRNGNCKLEEQYI